MCLRIITIACAMCFASVSQIVGQAWTQKNGTSYVQLGYSSISGESKYDNNGPALPLTRRVTDQTLQLSSKYGLSDRLTFVGNVPLKFVKTGNEIVSSGFSGDTIPSGNLTGLGNISISATYGLDQIGKWVYSVQLRADLNTAKDKPEAGLRTGVKAWGFAPSFHIGHGAKTFWSSLDAGFNIRSNKYSTQWFSNFQLGTNLGKSFSLIAQFDILQSFEDGTAPDGNTIETGLYTNNLEYAAYSLKLGYDIHKDMTIWGAIGGGVSGNDVIRAPAFSIAVSYKSQ